MIIEPGQEPLLGHVFDLLQNKSMLCALIRIASLRQSL